MAAGPTYTPIGTYTVPSNTTSYTFNSIPSGYTDIIVQASVASSSSNTLFIRFNNDGSALYSATRMSGSGQAAFSDRETRSSGFGALSNYAWPPSYAGYHSATIHVMNYSNSSIGKTYISRSNSATNGSDLIVGLYGSNSVISSIGFSTNGFAGTNTLLQGSVFTLYGIAAA